MRALLGCLVLAGLIVGIYSIVLDGPFQFDDQTSILENETLRSGDPIDWWRYWPTRAVTYTTLGLNYQSAGLDVFAYHWTNILIHILASLACAWFLRTLLPQASLWIVFAAAAVFALHPLQTQAVAYIIQRATSLYALFYFLCCAAYLRGGRWLVVAAFSGALSMLSKEPALSLPLALLLLDLARGRFDLRRWLPFSALWLLPLALLLGGDARFGNAFDASITGETSEVGRWQYALTQSEVLVRYLQLMFIPVGQNLDHDIAWRGLGPTTLPFLAAHALILLGAVWAYRRGHKFVALAVGWFYLTLLPESSLFPIADAMYEHRCYPAVLSLSLLFALGLGRIPLRFQVVATLGVCLALGTLSAQRNVLWADPMRLWQDALAKSPEKARPHMAVGWLYSNRGELTQAKTHLSRAVEIDPEYAMAWNNLGIAAQRLGDLDLAERSFSETIRIHPHEAVPRANRAGARRDRGALRGAEADFLSAVELDPSLRSAWHALAWLQWRLGDFEEAARSFDEARALGVRDAALADSLRSRSERDEN